MQTEDEDRIHELNQVKKSIQRKFDGYMFCYLARIDVFDLSKAPSKRGVTDIDSVVIKFNESRFIIELFDQKDCAGRSVTLAKRDLKKYVIPILNKNSKGRKIIPIKDCGAKIRIEIKSK